MRERVGSLEAHKWRRAARVVVGGAAIALGVGIGIPSPASADSTQHIQDTSGIGLHLRRAPHPTSDLIATLPEGSAFRAKCFVDSDSIDGNTKWEHGTDEATGDTGWVSDRYLDTGYYPSAEELKQEGIPECHHESEPLRDTPEYLGAYNRDAAASYAEAHAEDTPPASASCTQLVSRAMWHAGVPETTAWNDGEVNGQTFTFAHSRPGTDAAWRATALVAYLKDTFPKTTEHQLNFSENAVPDAEPGDVIAYDWQGDGVVDHLTMVVDKAPGEYPEVTEWSVGGGTEPTPYEKRGWTWSELRHEWLQQAYTADKIKAYLVHIDTRQAIAPDNVG